MESNEKMNCCGIDVPIIAKLSAGFSLVAHPNGPAIGTATLLESLESQSAAEVPRRVKSEAIRLYRQLTWPEIKHRYGYSS